MTDDGTVSTSAHTRTTIYRSSDGASWIPWLNAGSALQYGAHVMVLAGTLYIFDAKYTYTITATPAAIDLSNDVLFLQISETYDEPAQLSLTLDNSSLQYTSAPWLIDNATLTVNLGYSGQTVKTHTFYIDDWSLEASAERLALQLSARNALKALDVPSTQMLVYTSRTISQILTSICQNVPITLGTLPVTSQFSQTVPCFVVTPGQTFLTALKRLAAIYGFNFRADPTPSVIPFDPQPADPSQWSYGTEILASDYGQESNRPNVIRVTGATVNTLTVWSEAVDQTNLLLIGDERFRLIVDRMLDTAAKCQIRAANELRSIQRAATHATLVVPLNPQHELGDVISFTDLALGATDLAMRINAIAWSFSPSEALFQQQLRLEAP